MGKETVGKVVFPAERTLEKISKEDIQRALEEFAIEQIAKKRVLNALMGGFQDVEESSARVVDVVMGPSEYSLLRRYGKDILDPSIQKSDLQRGLFATAWGARIWAQESAMGINCYGEGSEQLGKDFPFIAESKRILNIED